jgi:AGZA family xanthine/uracil permease-like MFS transporter
MCGALGFTWQTAIAAVFVEGLIFIVISISGIREKIVDAIPDQLKKAVAIGIGLFIAVIGLSNSGILAVGGGTPVAFTSISSGAPLVAIIGLGVTIALYTLKVPGSIFIGIIAATVIGIPLGVTVMPESAVSAPPAPYMPWDIIGGLSSISITNFLVCLFSLLFIDLFDTVATLLGVASQGNLIDADGKVKNVKKALLADAIATSAGALIGATTVTSYIESSTGVAQGARTGLASVVTGVLFLVALIFSPIFLAIPAAATAPALIFVACLMINSLSNVDFSKLENAVPVTITMIAVPFSYSIATGLAWGFISYTLVKVCLGKSKELSIATWVITAIFLAKIAFGL